MSIQASPIFPSKVKLASLMILKPYCAFLLMLSIFWILIWFLSLFLWEIKNDTNVWHYTVGRKSNRSNRGVESHKRRCVGEARCECFLQWLVSSDCCMRSTGDSPFTPKSKRWEEKKRLSTLKARINQNGHLPLVSFQEFQEGFW